MSWLLGAGLGFLRGGPLGALVGGAMQHFITKKAKALIRKSLPGVENEALFVTCIVVVMTKVALAKGHITAGEVETIYRFFVKNLNYSTDELDSINQVILETCRVNPDLRPVIEKYKTAAKSNYRLLLLALAYQIALIDLSLDDNVQDGINELAALLNISKEEHNRIRGQYSLEGLATPYSLLGVSPNATDAEIKKAYRKLASQFHPDKVAHLGKEHVEASHLRFLEVQEAYRELAQERKL